MWLIVSIWATKQGHGETVDTLLRHRADPTLKDFSGRTAADWAQEAGHGSLLAVLETTTARSSDPRP